MKREQSYDRQEQKLLLKLDSVHFLPISSSNIYFEEKNISRKEFTKYDRDYTKCRNEFTKYGKEIAIQSVE